MRYFKFSLLIPVMIILSGCGTPSRESLAQNDPWEATNREIFAFDVKLDHSVARPVASAYTKVLPAPVREGIHNVLQNLNAPVVMANDLLQGDLNKTGTTMGRILVNSTVGLGGLIDVGTKLGLPGHPNDFGITLGKAGAAEGSYLVLPFAGPMPPRDLVGAGVDVGFDPLTYIRFHGSDTWSAVRFGTQVLDSRASQLDAVETIERSSIDFYATTRSLYRQSRQAIISGGAGTANTSTDLPNF